MNYERIKLRGLVTKRIPHIYTVGTNDYFAERAGIKNAYMDQEAKTIYWQHGTASSSKTKKTWRVRTPIEIMEKPARYNTYITGYINALSALPWNSDKRLMMEYGVYNTKFARTLSYNEKINTIAGATRLAVRVIEQLAKFAANDMRKKANNPRHKVNAPLPCIHALLIDLYINYYKKGIKTGTYADNLTKICMEYQSNYYNDEQQSPTYIDSEEEL